MASQFPVDDTDPTLLALEQAFHDVWTVLAAHEPYRDRTEDHERVMELSRTLMVLAANGVTDLAELRRLGFRSLLLPPSKDTITLQGPPKEDPSLAEAGDPEMAENLGVPEVQLGLVRVAPADPGRAETEDQQAAAGDQLLGSA